MRDDEDAVPNDIVQGLYRNVGEGLCALPLDTYHFAGAGCPQGRLREF